MATFIKTNDARFTRFLKRRFQSSTSHSFNAAVRTDPIALRGEHERLRMGI